MTTNGGTDAGLEVIASSFATVPDHSTLEGGVPMITQHLVHQNDELDKNDPLLRLVAGLIRPWRD
jgi:hypothetical protein